MVMNSDKGFDLNSAVRIRVSAWRRHFEVSNAEEIMELMRLGLEKTKGVHFCYSRPSQE
jgi:hypothetical protein